MVVLLEIQEGERRRMARNIRVRVMWVGVMRVVAEWARPEGREQLRRTLLNTIVVHRIRFSEGTCFRLIAKVVVIVINTKGVVVIG